MYKHSHSEKVRLQKDRHTHEGQSRFCRLPFFFLVFQWTLTRKLMQNKTHFYISQDECLLECSSQNKYSKKLNKKMRLFKLLQIFFLLLRFKILPSETQTHCCLKNCNFRLMDLLRLYTFTPKSTTPFRAPPCQSLGFGLQTFTAEPQSFWCQTDRTSV